MELAVVSPAKRDGELVAHLAPERPNLREAQVMGIGGFASAYEARTRGHEFQVGLVAVAPHLRDAEHALVNAAKVSLPRLPRDALRSRAGSLAGKR